jgi:iron complex transport system substrate-binding protein
MHQRTSRRMLATGTAAAIALLMVACSTAADTTSPSPGADAASPGASTEAFPVTVAHKYGDVTIEAEPQRVVTIGSREHELLYSLGVAPVAVPESWQGYPHGTGPWAEEARFAVGAEPDTFPSGELNVELIASFAPDLIVGTYSGITEDQYTQLSQIAPTIAQSGEFPEYGMPLNEELALIGAAVGKSPEAEQVTAEIDAAFAEVREAHPDWEGQTGIVAFHYDGNPGVYHSSDNRNQFLANLGLDSTGLDEYLNDEFYIPISAEQLDLLDVFDTVVWQTATTPEVQGTIEGLPLYPELTVTQQGGNIWITEPVLEGAFFANSPSSILFSLDAFVPQLEAALDGDSATDVPAFAYAGE